MKKITKKQEQTYRLCHPSFGGLSYAQAAIKMGITEDAVYKLLARMKETAPRLFPILSLEHAEIWNLWQDAGLTCKDIASLKGTTERSIQAKLRLIKKKMGHDTQQRQIINIDCIDESQVKFAF